MKAVFALVQLASILIAPTHAQLACGGNDTTTAVPTFTPTSTTIQPTVVPTPAPTTTTTLAPTFAPTTTTLAPTAAPTTTTVVAPTTTTVAPTAAPTTTTVAPTAAPTTTTVAPTAAPTTTTVAPTAAPTTTTVAPTAAPTTTTTVAPTSAPTTTKPAPISDNFWVHHDGYSLSYNCARRTADRWNFTLVTDKRNGSRPSSFYVDPLVPKECHQFTTNSYASVRAGFDRGHLVASSMMTDTQEQRRQSHYMTNIAPQVATFNQGIWENTEDIEACYRNLNRIYSWGGILYTDEANDYFLTSHGIRTPDFWWKVILTTDETGNDKIISWYFPNAENLGALDKYLVSVDDIEAKLNDNLGGIPVPAALKSFKATASWPKPAGCVRT